MAYPYAAPPYAAPLPDEAAHPEASAAKELESLEVADGERISRVGRSIRAGTPFVEIVRHAKERMWLRWLWASAEWASIIRNWFVREERDHLVLGSGLPEEWLGGRNSMKLGPTPTTFGDISVEVKTEPNQIQVKWGGTWHEQPPMIEVRLPNREPTRVGGEEGFFCLATC
jgi:hypothetical protein